MTPEYHIDYTDSQLSVVKSGSGSSKGVEVETVPVVDPVFSGDYAGKGKIEEIRVELSLELN